MKKIACVTVFLDDGVPEDMMGIIRIGSVVSEDEDGKELASDQDLVDNKEFQSREELIGHVAKMLRVSEDIINIEP